IARVRRLALTRLQAGITSRRTRLAVKGLELGTLFLALAKGLLRVAAFAACAACAYVWLTFVLVQFPYTHPWGELLGTYLSHALTAVGTATIAAVPGLFIVAVILLVTRILSNAVSQVFLAVEAGRLTSSWLEAETARATRRLVVLVIWAF